MTRTAVEIILMNNCQHNFKGMDNSDQQIEVFEKYGYKNCCICKLCGIGCGELLNAPYINFSKEVRIMLEKD